MHQVCLVSDQQVPNFLPLLEMRPEKLTLVVSPQMKANEQYLRAAVEVLQPIKIEPDICISDASDLTAIQSALISWLDSHAEEDDVVLNVTGGTKLMAIAAQEAFRMGDRPVFYVDIRTDEVLWLNKAPENACRRLTRQISLKLLLGLSGITIESGAFKSAIENPKWRVLADTLIKDVATWGGALRNLNECAMLAKRASSKEVGWPSVPAGNWEALLEKLETNELIKKVRGQWVFRGTVERTYCNGIWLEHAVFETIKRLGFDKRSAMMNVHIKDSSGNTNELDAAIIAKNTFYAIECKTRNMKREDIADDAVYKLAKLREKGGLRAYGILVSYFVLRPEDCKRAKAYDVTVIDSLINLESRLRTVLHLAGAPAPVIVSNAKDSASH